MKKTICGALICALLLAVCAGCGQTEPEEEPSFPAALTIQTLLDSGAFSEELVELDPMLLFPLSGEEADYEGSVLYYSTGATAETAAVISVRDAEQVYEVAEALRSWLEYQIEAERDYRPVEVEKLENAIIEIRGNSVLLVVAADWRKAVDAVETVVTEK